MMRMSKDMKPVTQTKQTGHSLDLVPTITHFLVKVHLDLEDELKFLIGDEGCQRAVDFMAGFHCLPVVLILQVDLVAAGSLLIVVPAGGALLCGAKARVKSSSVVEHFTVNQDGAGSNTPLCVSLDYSA